MRRDGEPPKPFAMTYCYQLSLRLSRWSGMLESLSFLRVSRIRLITSRYYVNYNLNILYSFDLFRSIYKFLFARHVFVFNVARTNPGPRRRIMSPSLTQRQHGRSGMVSSSSRITTAQPLPSPVVLKGSRRSSESCRKCLTGAY
jgi:hypothetical protein